MADQCNLISALGVSAPIVNNADIQFRESGGVPFPFPGRSSFESLFAHEEDDDDEDIEDYDEDDEDDDEDEDDEDDEVYYAADEDVDESKDYDVPADMDNEDGILEAPEAGYEYYFTEGNYNEE